MSYRRWIAIFFTVLSIVLSIIIWLQFAPVKLGGQANYVIVDGNSMEPGFQLGDLVVVRKTSSYLIGDIVTYRDAQLSANIIHRIIGYDQDRFVTKGDNNSWIDSYEPVRDEIIGKLWIHIPKLGRGFVWLRVPLNMALTMGLLGGILMAGMLIKPPQNGNRRNRSSGLIDGMLEGLLFVTGFVFLAFLGLGIFTFTRPLTAPADNIQYQQEGFFFYSATGAPTVYDTDTVHSGEPIFPKLTCFLNVGFAYNILSAQLQGISGSYQMVARVMDNQSGWQRTIPMVQETAFKSNSYFTMTTLDLCQVETMVNLVEQETGLHAGTYDLDIVMHVATASTMAGTAITDTFDPTLVFKFDKTHFFLAADPSKADPMHFSKQGQAGNANLQANTIPLLGWQPSVLSLRVISLLGLGLSLVLLMMTGWYVFNKARQSPDALFRLKYGALLVDVYEQNLDPTAQVIDVSSMDDLAKLAERQNTMILHMIVNFLHYYLVQSNGTVYRYVFSSGKRGAIEIGPAFADVVEYKPGLGETDFTESEPVWNGIPVYETGTEENRMTESEPVNEGTVEQMEPASENATEQVEPPSEESSSDMIGEEKNNLVPEKPADTGNGSLIPEGTDEPDRVEPGQKEMLRFTFGPYGNHDQDKGRGDGR